MSYHSFVDEDGRPFGSCEVFFFDGARSRMQSAAFADLPGPGWYWAPGFPGCLWDGEPHGPFESKAKALRDAGAVLP